MQQYEYARGDQRGEPSPQTSYSSEISQIIAASSRSVASRPRVKGLVIDPRGAKDRDDAIWVERVAEGKYKADITIASVGEFIQQGSLIDLQAKAKGLTQYVRRRAVDPMLPVELSEQALSLQYGQLRPTITISVTLNQTLKAEDIQIKKTSFYNDRDLTYEDGTRILQNSTDYHHGMLAAAAEVAYLLQEQRTKKQRKKNRKPRQQDIHTIIEEFMLLGNRAVSEYGLAHSLPIIFRNHPNMYDDMSAPPSVPGGSAYYSAINKGHKGLKLDSYDQVTSPLRRYPDLHNQRVLLAHLDGKNSYSQDHAREVSQIVNAAEYARRNHPQQSQRRRN